MEKLRKLILKLINDKADVQTIIQEVNKFYNRNLTFEEFKLIIIEQLGLIEKFGNNTLSDVERVALATLFKDISQDYALTKKGVQKKIVKLVTQSLKNDASTKEIRTDIQNVIGNYRNYADTITRTAVKGFDSYVKYPEPTKEQKFKYAGASAERPFCQKLLRESQNGKTYTYAEILRLDNKQGLNPFRYCGGFNCRHFWIEVF